MGERQKTPADPRRLPPWLRKRLSAGPEARQVARLLKDLGLSTVCTAAKCPNQSECHGRGTATFLILGERCTRRCRFCAIEAGEPLPPREDEPQAVAEACARMGLKYVVVTSVTRDDLSDGGAAHFARTILAVRQRLPGAIVEVLTPDFRGETSAIDVVLEARPDVFGHNVETVPRLYPSVRPPGGRQGVAPDYRRSLEVLAYLRRWSAKIGGNVVAANSAANHGTKTNHGTARRPLVKSGLMLGVGETDEEVRQVLADLRGVGLDMLTLGQYLAPSADHWPVARFVEPAEFERWQREARGMGFPSVVAGPFVRSSYHAETAFEERT